MKGALSKGATMKGALLTVGHHTKLHGISNINTNILYIASGNWKALLIHSWIVGFVGNHSSRQCDIDLEEQRDFLRFGKYHKRIAYSKIFIIHNSSIVQSFCILETCYKATQALQGVNEQHEAVPMFYNVWYNNKGFSCFRVSVYTVIQRNGFFLEKQT